MPSELKTCSCLVKIYVFGLTLDVLILDMRGKGSQKSNGCDSNSKHLASTAVVQYAYSVCMLVHVTDAVVGSLGNAASVLAAAPLLLKGQTDVTLQW